MGIEDVIMMIEKEAPPTISRPTNVTGGYNSYLSPQLTSQLGQGNGMAVDDFYMPHFVDDFEPYLDGRTRIHTNPHEQFGIGV